MLKTAAIFTSLIVIFFILVAISEDVSTAATKHKATKAAGGSAVAHLPNTNDIHIETIRDNPENLRWTDEKNKVVCYVHGSAISCTKL